ncbi:PadR family transcriptional regulator [Spiractinospora alimapuensis]|uniref:PadR family transcriptional regulator n=1 Tax=Spiractinospora alimapuensis TaxID=2820884 RepID=UPI001F1D6AC0|nr:PadR family transcriptional regulator [Spiractinospora alimapuensis]QVQ54022.1 PadR family transcriptional regulator [Spiractinospora alimapuensis]
MANVILGLLLIRQMSLYDLVKGFESGVSLFYSASTGSIKRALDTLLTRGLVEVASVEPGARGRKVYRPTDAGRTEFQAWMRSDLTGSDLEAAVLSRLYFLGLLPAEERAPALRRIITRVEAHLSTLTTIKTQADSSTVPEELRDVATHQLATLDYGISSDRFTLEWFREHLRRLEASTATED